MYEAALWCMRRIGVRLAFLFIGGLARSELDIERTKGPLGACVLLSPAGQVKSRITPQLHRAGHQAGAIKPVRRAGWEWAASPLQQQRAAWAECTCAGAHMSIFLSFSIARASSILPLSRSATSRSASKCNTGSREADAPSLAFTPHSVHRAEHFHAVRLGAVLWSVHVAVD